MPKCACGCGRNVKKRRERCEELTKYASRKCFLKRQDPSPLSADNIGEGEIDFNKPESRDILFVLADIGSSWAMGILRNMFGMTCFTDTKDSLIFFDHDSAVRWLRS